MASEIAALRQQIAAEEESAQLALNGYAAVASHETIVHKFEFDTEEVRRLFAAGKDVEAEALWESLEW
jgi:hypothetical protein